MVNAYETNLTAKWDFNKSTYVAPIQDFVGSKNVTTTAGTPTVTLQNSGAYRINYGGAARQYTAATTLFASATFTLEIGFRISSASAVQQIFTRTISSTGQYGWRLYTDANGKLNFQSYSAGTQAWILTSASSFAANTDYHVTIRCTGTTAYLHIDGNATSDASVACSTAPNETRSTPIYVGYDLYNTTYGSCSVYFIRAWSGTDIGTTNVTNNYNAEKWRWLDSVPTAKIRYEWDAALPTNKMDVGYDNMAAVDADRHATAPSGATYYTGCANTDSTYANLSSRTANLSGPTTFEFIVTPTDLNSPDYSDLICLWTSGYNYLSYFIFSDGKIFIYRQVDSSNGRGYTSTNACITAGHTYHIQVVWDFSTFTATPVLYVSELGTWNSTPIPLTDGSTGTVTSWPADNTAKVWWFSEVGTATSGLTGDEYLSQFWRGNLNATQLEASFNAEKWRYAASNDCSVSMPTPGTTFNDIAVTPAIVQSRAVSMPVPTSAFNDVAATPSIVQSRAVTMPVPTSVFDEVVVTPAIVSDNKTVSMPTPGTTMNDVAVTSVLNPNNPTVSIPTPSTAMNDVAVTSVINPNNPTVAMTVPGTVFNDVAATPAIVQSRAVSMPVPTSVFDEVVVTPAIVQSRAVTMPVPTSAFNDVVVTPARVQSRAVTMPTPSTTMDDVALGSVGALVSPDTEVVLTGVISDSVELSGVIDDTITLVAE